MILSLLITFAVFTIFISVWFTTVITNTIANNNLKQYRDGNNENLSNAANYTRWSNIIGWSIFTLLLIITIFVVILLIFGLLGPDELVAAEVAADVTAEVAESEAKSLLGKNSNKKSGLGIITIIILSIISLFFMTLVLINGYLAYEAFKNLVEFVNSNIGTINNQSRIRTSLLVSIVASFGSFGIFVSFIIAIIASKLINGVAKEKGEVICN